MKNWALIFATLILCASSSITAQPAAAITTLQQFHTLTNQQAAQRLPVSFEAIVTYYRSYERTLFVQDGQAAVYIQYPQGLKLVPGDRIRVEGITQPSFHPIVAASKVTLLHHGETIDPVPAQFTDLSHARYDSMLVRVHARILSADISVSSDRPNTRLTLLINGAP